MLLHLNMETWTRDVESAELVKEVLLALRRQETIVLAHEVPNLQLEAKSL